MPTFQAKDYKGIVIRREEFPNADKDTVIDAILERIADNVGIELPQEVIEQEAAILMQGYMAQRRYQSMASDDYLKVVMEIQMERETLMEHFRAEAAKDLKIEKVLRGIIEAEQLTADREELEAEAAAMAKRQNATLAQVKQFFGESLSMLERDVLMGKARELVYNCAVVQEGQGTEADT